MGEEEEEEAGGPDSLFQDLTSQTRGERQKWGEGSMVRTATRGRCSVQPGVSAEEGGGRDDGGRAGGKEGGRRKEEGLEPRQARTRCDKAR